MQYVCSQLDTATQTCLAWSEYQPAIPTITQADADIMLGFFLRLMVAAFVVIMAKRALLNER